jgi:hypothetical protein
MMTPDHEGARLVRYLLGQLPAEEQAEVEERYLSDPEYHLELRAAERDLIDRYVRGELPDRDAFETHYLSSPPRRARLEFAQALAQWSDRSPAVAAADSDVWSLRGVLGGVLRWQVAAAVALALLGSWFVLTRRGEGPETQVGTTTGSGGTVRTPSTSGPQSPEPARSGDGLPAAVATLVLMPDLTRSGDSLPTLVAAAGTSARLQLELESADYMRYRAVVRTADGTEVWRDDQVKPTQSSSGPGLVITVPAARLLEDDYTIRIGGVTGSGEIDELSGYAFRVRRP